MRPPIDRYAVVSRNNPMLEQLDPYGPFSVGNGEFCFTADVTGLQSFYGYYYEHGFRWKPRRTGPGTVFPIPGTTPSKTHWSRGTPRMAAESGTLPRNTTATLRCIFAPIPTISPWASWHSD